ncbi:MAG TPA: hypothetical protein VK920_09495 [Solirubrobacterales bacterium]|nr:hypothetical protein [Solirubrobacterales bacterium]
MLGHISGLPIEELLVPLLSGGTGLVVGARALTLKLRTPGRRRTR